MALTNIAGFPYSFVASFTIQTEFLCEKVWLYMKKEVILQPKNE